MVRGPQPHSTASVHINNRALHSFCFTRLGFDKHTPVVTPGTLIHLFSCSSLGPCTAEPRRRSSHWCLLLQWQTNCLSHWCPGTWGACRELFKVSSWLWEVKDEPLFCSPAGRGCSSRVPCTGSVPQGQALPPALLLGLLSARSLLQHGLPWGSQPPSGLLARCGLLRAVGHPNPWPLHYFYNSSDYLLRFRQVSILVYFSQQCI